MGTPGAKHILLVEDDIDIRDSLREVLELEGYDVALATNGQDALDQLRKDSPLPDVILLDLMMPVKDGLQFRAEQTKDPRLAGIPVVLMSADHNVEGKSGQMKSNSFLRKPVEIADLLATIGALCG